METGKKIAVTGATGRVGRHAVEVLKERGNEVVPMSRSTGVDIVTGEGLTEALAGVECVIDVATWPTPDQQEATEFFTTATRNLHEAGERTGVRRIVVVSIIGTDQASSGYYAAKLAHEQAMLAGPIPVRILRAAQFHEFVPVLMQWGRQADVCYLPKMRTQLVAARTVAEALVDLATDPEFAAVPKRANEPFPEIAGPREENLAAMAGLLAARSGDAVTLQEVSNPDDPNSRLYENGGLLPSPHATLAGPTFEEWLNSVSLDRRG